MVVEVIDLINEYIPLYYYYTTTKFLSIIINFTIKYKYSSNGKSLDNTQGKSIEMAQVLLSAV